MAWFSSLVLLVATQLGGRLITNTSSESCKRADQAAARILSLSRRKNQLEEELGRRNVGAGTTYGIVPGWCTGEITGVLPEADSMRLVVYAIRVESGKNGDRTIENVNYFLRHGLLASDNVRYVFIVMEGSRDDPRLEWGQAMGEGRGSNVCIRAAVNFDADLCIYPSLLRELDLGFYRHFIFINSGTRGPFFEERIGPVTWLDRATNKLVGSTGLVGATVSCDVFPHVQSYAIAMDSRALAIALELWADTSVDMRRAITSRNTIPVAMEVGLSRRLLAKGIGIEEWGEDAMPLSFTAIRQGRSADRDRMTLCTKRLGSKNPCNDPTKIMYPQKNIFVKYKYAMDHHPLTVELVDKYTASADVSRSGDIAGRFKQIPDDMRQKHSGKGGDTSFRLGSTDVTACFDCTQEGASSSRHCQGL
jgi:hypothetical protein